MLMSRNQIYSDWLYLWWAAYTNSRKMGGHVYIMLKDQIQYIPFVGLGLRLAGFIFMSRKMQTDQPRLAHRMKQLSLRGSKGLNPMWLLIFPEGTNLGINGRAKSNQWAAKQGIEDMKYQLIPRSTGTYFCLKALEGNLEWVYDCTVAYDGAP
jgi:lysocardiolipin and lysophospholipid acyltransferase